MNSSNKQLNFLAIDTSGKDIGVALCYNNVTLSLVEPQKKASEALLPLIDNLVIKASADLKALDFIAVSIGPGSFTGIRIGLVTARTLCQALNKKLLALTYPQILSYNIKSAKDDIITLSDAGNSFFYAARFDINHESVGEPIVLTKDEAAQFLMDNKNSHIILENEVFGANALIEAAFSEYNKRGAVKYQSVEPLYIRQPQAVADLEKKNL